MSINPVELQVLIPKSVEVGKAQNVANRQDILQQQHVAEQWNGISENRQQQVQRTDKNEGGKIGKEKNGKQQNSSPDNGKNKKDRKRAEDSAANRASHEDPIRGHMIDIKT